MAHGSKLQKEGRGAVEAQVSPHSYGHLSRYWISMLNATATLLLYNVFRFFIVCERELSVLDFFRFKPN
jgi:hypothetical protein